MLPSSTKMRRGGVAVKLAVALPLVAYLGIVAADWGRLIHTRITVQNCARAGALYAADPSRASESSHPDVTAAALSESSKLTRTPTVTSTPAVVDGHPTVRVAVSVPFTPTISLPGAPPEQLVSRSLEIPVLAVTPR